MECEEKNEGNRRLGCDPPYYSVLCHDHSFFPSDSIKRRWCVTKSDVVGLVGRRYVEEAEGNGEEKRGSGEMGLMNPNSDV